MNRHLALLFVAAVVALPSQVAYALTGGPDAFGYTFIDSDETGGPVYTWIDISSTGTATGIGDDDEVTVALPFTFYFYGEPYTSVTIGDGVVLLGDDTGIDNGNQCLPANNFDGDDALVMGMWDDLDATAVIADDVYYQVVGSAPYRMMVVQYEDIPHFNSVTAYTFEFLLVETTNEIVLQYASVLGPEPSYSAGASATVGIQPDPNDGLEYSCDSGALLHDELAISFDVVCPDDDGDGVGPCDGDCDDADDTIGPNAGETPDGVDNDCDGLVDEDFISPGDLVITEFLCNPELVDDEVGEWFELTNTSGRDVDLINWTLTDENGSDGIDESLVIAPGATLLFAVSGNANANGGLPQVDWVFDYDAVNLTNDGDQLGLWMGTIEIENLTYDPWDWPIEEGRSSYLDDAYHDGSLNDSPYPWCVTPADPQYDSGTEGGGYGTPGEANPPEVCCFELDGDGVSTCDGDCDDSEAASYPSHVEDADGLDNDCDGLIDEDFVAAGDVVVSEFLDDPWLVAAEDAEWVELHNGTGSNIHLLGWSVFDASGLGFEIREDVVIPAGGFAVLAASDDPDDNGNLPQVDYAYDYESFSLSSYEDDDIILMMGAIEIDAVAYSNMSAWPSAPGQSDFLSSTAYDATANDDVENWCLTPAGALYDYGGEANYGTPGADNPAATADADGDGHTICDGDCDDSDATVHPSVPEDCEDGIDNDCDGRIDDEDSDCVEGDDDSADDDDSVDDDTPGDDDSAGATDDCSCRVSGRATSPAAVAVLALLWMVRRTRRSNDL